MPRPIKHFKTTIADRAPTYAKRPYLKETIQEGEIFFVTRNRADERDNVWARIRRATRAKTCEEHLEEAFFTTEGVSLFAIDQAHANLVGESCYVSWSKWNDATPGAAPMAAPTTPEPQPEPEPKPEEPKLPEPEDGDHKQQPLLMAAIKAGLVPYLCGPSGTGKTTAARKAAQALEVPFYDVVFACDDQKHDHLGYLNVNGDLVPTGLLTAWEKGGLVLLDEIDQAPAGVLKAINAFLETGTPAVRFANGEEVTRHEDFKVVTAGNTRGRGQEPGFTAEGALDNSSISRFFFIDWGYDEALEVKLSGHPEWAKKCHAMRKAALDLGLEGIEVSPRAIIEGAKAIKAGLPESAVIRGKITGSLDDETADRLLAAAGVA